MKLAREGWEISATVVFIATVLLFINLYLAAIAWVAVAFVLQFFRQPFRPIITVDKEILSPADGCVIFVGSAPSPFDGEMKTKISIFMNVFNVHANHSPVNGKVLHSERFLGKFVNAALDKASTDNERHLLVIDSPYGRVDCMQIAGLLARRILCYAKVDDTLVASKKYGFIRFGSRVDLYLPPTCNINVAITDKVKAGVNTIAKFESDENQAP